MPKSYYRHKLLLDEQLYARESYPRLNEYFDLKHIRDDLHMGSAKDPRVEDVAKADGRIVITQNGKHFRGLVTAGSPGVIDIPGGWSPAQVDTKLTAVLKRHGPKYFAGRYRTLATE